MPQAGHSSRKMLSAMAIALGLTGLGVAQADGSIAGYQEEVSTLTTTLDTLVSDYRQDRNSDDDLATLRQQWKTVEFHEALEEHAKPLYPLIWQALSGLEESLKQDAEVSEVADAADQVRSALWQGLGALRMAQASPASHDPEDQGDAATLTAIQQALDEALGEYYEGEIEEAKELIHTAYMQRFEGIEGKLIAQDPELVESLEEDFNATLPTRMQQGNDQQVSALVTSMKDRLDEAREMLAGQEQQEVF